MFTAQIRLLFVLLLFAHAEAQVDDAYIKVDLLGGQKVPKALLTTISVELKDVTFEQALITISERTNLSFNYNRSRIPLQQKVSVRMQDAYALEILLDILNKTNTELLVGSDGFLVIAPSEHRPTYRGTVRGRVLDRETKAPMTGVNVILLGTKTGTATGEDGEFYLENIPVGSYVVEFDNIGYERLKKTDVIVKANRVTFINVELKISPLAMDSVVVRGDYFPQIEEQPVSAVNFSSEELRRGSGTIGDVSRLMFGLPSVAKVNDSFSSLIVRGGSPSENSFIVDNVELPYINHFALQGTSGGLMTIFPGDLVRDVSFYSGGFSAAYGDKLSSVMNVVLREGNREEFDMQLDMNFAGVGGVAEGPLPGHRGSWLVGARKSFIELLFKIMGESGNIPAYSDFQTKLVYDMSPRHKLSFFNIHGISDLSSTRDDALNDGENEYGDVQWTQQNAGLNWRMLWNKKGYSNTSLSHSMSRFNWHWFLTNGNSELLDNNSLEQQFGLRHVSTYKLNDVHKLTFGLDAKFLRTRYDQRHARHNDLLGNMIPEFQIDEKIRSRKYGGFLSHSWQPLAGLTLTSGLRADHFAYNHHSHLSPRLSLSHQLSPKTSVSASFGKFYQNLPLVLLYQKDSFEDLRDPLAFHYILSLSHLLAEDTRFTIEGYEKQYKHMPLDPGQPSLFIIDQPVYQITRFTPHEDLVDNGEAFSRGVEITLQKKLASKLYGLISGTYYRTRYRDFDGVWRNRIYDNRFAFNIEGGFKPNAKWEFSIRWTYAGGRPYTPLDIEASAAAQQGVYDQERINAERLPVYNSLNLRFDRRFYFSGSNLIFYFSVWNALNSQNVWHYSWNEVANYQEKILQFERSPIFGLEFEF